MCGRFTLTSTPEALAERFGLAAPLDFEPRFNIAPGQEIIAVRREDGVPGATRLRWGLVPHWAEDAAVGHRMINARAETLAEKPAFRGALRSRRCLIPADGFYEWASAERGRQPHHIHRVDRALFGIAGLWEHWRDPEGELLETCTLVTRSAEGPVSELHDRMPAILDPARFDAWLDPSLEDPAKILPLLQAAGPALDLHPVSQRVNQTVWDDAECLTAVPALPRQQGLFS